MEECRYAYIWADGVYLGAGVDRTEDCAAMRGGGKGGRSAGTAEVWSLAILRAGEYERCAEELEGSERSECSRYWRWETVQLGLWAALDAVSDDRSSEVLEPPCAEVQAKLPKSLNSGAKAVEGDVVCADPSGCERLRDECVSDLRADGR